MIRPCKESDLDAVVRIWYEASVIAHAFVPADFWASKKSDMKHIYLPAAENWVFEEEGEIKGFISLVGSRICALFVSPVFQGRGIGKALLGQANKLSREEGRGPLSLKVFKENRKARRFYEKCGFRPVAEEVEELTGCENLLMEWS